MKRHVFDHQVTLRGRMHASDRARYRLPVRGLATAIALGVGFLAGFGCEGSSEPSTESNVAALKACHLFDGTVDARDKIGACDPGDKHKTTICHIPPGNPANAHTLCVGNPAVPAHLQNHGDSLGQCQQEQPCPPPPGDSTGTGGSGDSGNAGAPGTGGTPGGSAGAGGIAISVG